MSIGCIDCYDGSSSRELKEFRLQEQIDSASAYETIVIPPGTYIEQIKIDKPLTLTGSGTSNTVIDGNGTDSIIEVMADNVIISNISVRHSGGYNGDAGISIHSNKNIITNCIFYATRTGLFLNASNDNVIYNCTFNRSSDGVFNLESNDNNFIFCRFQYNSFGINIKDSEGIMIDESIFHTNGIGIYVKDSNYIELNGSAIYNNNQDGGGIWAMGCNNSKILNCNIHHNGVGLKLKDSEVNVISCTLSQNMYNALFLEEAENVFVKNCEIIDSMRTAIQIKQSQAWFHNNNIEDSTLYGLDCDRMSVCDFRNNWWGRKRGPSFSELNEGEKVVVMRKNVLLYPWRHERLDAIGSGWPIDEDIISNIKPVSYWKDINFDGLDSDFDGAPDWWERKWGFEVYSWENHYELDLDNDGLNNIEECYTDGYGSNPFYRDVFIEIDWASHEQYSNKPSDEYIDKIVSIFKDHDINIHFDVGNLGGGGKIPLSVTSTCTDVRDIYWDYFLENSINNPRKGIFRYCVIMNENEEMWDGFVFVGWDHLDTIGICIDTIQQSHKLQDRSKLICSIIIHELGHIFGLLINDHGGIDNVGAAKIFTVQGWTYKNYMSCLNYRYTYDILDYSDGTHGNGDFNDWGNLDYYFFKQTEFS